MLFRRFSSCGWWPLGVPCTLAGDPQTSNYFHNNAMMLSAFSLCWHLHWWLQCKGGYNCWLFNTSQGGAGELSSSHCVLHCHGQAVIKMSVYLRISWTKEQNNYFYLNLDPECKSVQCSVWWKWSVAKALLLSLRLKETHCVTELSAELAGLYSDFHLKTSPWTMVIQTWIFGRT